MSFYVNIIHVRGNYTTYSSFFLSNSTITIYLFYISKILFSISIKISNFLSLKFSSISFSKIHVVSHSFQSVLLSLSLLIYTHSGVHDLFICLHMCVSFYLIFFYLVAHLMFVKVLVFWKWNNGGNDDDDSDSGGEMGWMGWKYVWFKQAAKW